MNTIVSPSSSRSRSQQVEDGGLHADVERRHRLVGDQDVGAQRERPGDRHPLPLAAGELARVRGQVRLSSPTSASSSARTPRPDSREPRGAPAAARRSIPPTVIRGFSEEYGSWKTIWMRRRSARERDAGSTLPPKRISPRSVLSSPTRAWASVDLPDPDSPTRASASPRRISRSTPSTARSRRSSPRARAATREPTGNATETSRAESSGSAGKAAFMGEPDLPRRPPACARSADRRWTARPAAAAAVSRWSGSRPRRTRTAGGTGSRMAG